MISYLLHELNSILCLDLLTCFSLPSTLPLLNLLSFFLPLSTHILSPIHSFSHVPLPPSIFLPFPFPFPHISVVFLEGFFILTITNAFLFTFSYFNGHILHCTVTSCCVMLCHVMSCHVMSCSLLFCSALSSPILPCVCVCVGMQLQPQLYSEAS